MQSQRSLAGAQFTFSLSFHPSGPKLCTAELDWSLMARIAVGHTLIEAHTPISKHTCTAGWLRLSRLSELREIWSQSGTRGRTSVQTRWRSYLFGLLCCRTKVVVLNFPGILLRSVRFCWFLAEALEPPAASALPQESVQCLRCCRLCWSSTTWLTGQGGDWFLQHGCFPVSAPENGAVVHVGCAQMGLSDVWQ